MRDLLLDLRHPHAVAAPLDERYDRVCPRPLATLEDFLHFTHQDLGDLPDAELARQLVELKTIEGRLLPAARPPWLEQRIAILAGARARRLAWRR